VTLPKPSGQAADARLEAGLLGRLPELETIDALLAGRGPAGRSLLLRGDPGVGKSALLDAAGARADGAGVRVLRVTGAPFEARIDFSALHQLLYGVREFAERLPGGQRAALGHIFGFATGPPPEPLMTSAAVLGLLSEVAADRPLLILVDDVQWADGRSATALGFVARRSADTPATFLAAVRSGAQSLFDQVRLPERTIGPLPAPAAAMLLDSRSPGLPGVARNELRAAGVATGRHRAAAALTPQERQIATLAATGLTNKQIAERLFLSHRTVGAHLHRLFPKLGITSRGALRGALEAHLPDDEEPGTGAPG
jgi:DNA-binding NarL/FixJ family response regulator